MKRLRSIAFTATLLLILSAACAPQGSLRQRMNGVGAGAATPSPSPSSTASDTTVAQTIQSLTVAHPPMQVGSIDRYFDGALLDAVPNDGPFIMGSGTPGSPQLQVTVSSYWIYSTEVSNQMYAWCVSLGKCAPPNRTDNPNFNDSRYVNYPVVGVTWQQAADYCSFAHGRLPTEAEWEKAASWDASLKQKRLYPWGDHAPSCDLLNFKYCLNRASPVTSYGQGASFYGLYNMAGNVAEWVGDWLQSDYSKAVPDTNPAGPQSGTLRVIRSSGYDSDAVDASPAARFSAAPSSHRPDLGFRCVVKDASYFAPFCRMPVFYGLDPATTGLSTKPCPDPMITHAEACTPDNRPVEFVTVQNTPPTTVTVKGLEACDPANNEVGVAHACAPGVTVQVQATCDVAPTGSIACPPNFQQDPANPAQCTSPGGVGACPSGFQYDNTLKCCTAAPGNTAAAPLCAVGQHLFEGACVNDYGGPQQPSSITFTTGGLECVLPTSSGPSFATSGPRGTPTAVIPFPIENPPGPKPKPTEPPPVTCDLKPKDCLFGLDKKTCTCKLVP